MRRPLSCRALTEAVTDYLDDAVDAPTRRRIERHLDRCAHCRRVLRQWEAVVALTGGLREEDLAAVDEATRARLLAAFRQERGA